MFWSCSLNCPTWNLCSGLISVWAVAIESTNSQLFAVVVTGTIVSGLQVQVSNVVVKYITDLELTSRLGVDAQ